MELNIPLRPNSELAPPTPPAAAAETVAIRRGLKELHYGDSLRQSLTKTSPPKGMTGSIWSFKLATADAL